MSEFEETATAPTPAPAPVNQVEHWATLAGFLPEVMPTKPPSRNPNWWKFSAAKALYRWPIGKEMTQAQFASAIIDAATGVQHG
jgi:hypothetical protein